MVSSIQILSKISLTSALAAGSKAVQRFVVCQSRQITNISLLLLNTDFCLCNIDSNRGCWKLHSEDLGSQAHLVAPRPAGMSSSVEEAEKLLKKAHKLCSPSLFDFRLKPDWEAAAPLLEQAALKFKVGTHQTV